MRCRCRVVRPRPPAWLPRSGRCAYRRARGHDHHVRAPPRTNRIPPGGPRQTVSDRARASESRVARGLRRESGPHRPASRPFEPLARGLRGEAGRCTRRSRRRPGSIGVRRRRSDRATRPAIRHPLRLSVFSQPRLDAGAGVRRGPVAGPGKERPDHRPRRHAVARAGGGDRP